MEKYKDILRYLNIGMSQNEISKTLKTSRNTVRKVKIAADAIGLEWTEASKMTISELESTLFPEVQNSNDELQPKSDCEMMLKELQRKGVTRKLLWEEYANEVKAAGKIPLQYSQFCNYFNSYLKINKATMHFEHKAAERIEVDWCGAVVPIIDSLTGETSKVYVFVGTLPYSQYSYCEVMSDMKEENWITAHVHMLEFFGGSTPIIYPDNLKTGVIKHTKEEVVLNNSYKEFGDYYNIAIVPTLPRSPKGKPSVEGTVGKITTQIIAKMRNEIFESVYQANEAFKKELESFNNKPFQKRNGSRKEVFENEEKEFLRPLPKIPYEYATWKIATVQYNYHISIDKKYYSVPYKYIKQKVNVRITKNLIEIYYDHIRICSHKRIYGHDGQYSTSLDHMPANHIKASEWDGKRFRNWARSIGKNTYTVIDRLLKNYRAEQQAYNGCRSILKLADSYTPLQLENACKQALSVINVPRYKNIKLIIEYNQDNHTTESDTNNDEYAIVRGATYYGGNN